VRIDGAVDVSAILRSGVYVLLCQGAIVYVGKSKVMLTRVYSHRSTWGRKRTEAQPRGVVFDEVHVVPVSLDAVDELERVLIAKYKPRYNTQYNNGLPPDIALLVQSLIPSAPPVAQPKLYRRF
jgi:excinuclease UvrABC nuclease subunit